MGLLIGQPSILTIAGHPGEQRAAGRVKIFQNLIDAAIAQALSRFSKAMQGRPHFIQVMAGDKPALNAKNLDAFDAVFFFGAGPGNLNEQQMQDLLAFVKDDGKGFVAAHTGDNAFQQYPDYREMIGGLWNHPWTKSENLEVDLPVIVEDPSFPAMQSLPSAFMVHDEAAVHLPPYSRDNVRVLARLDLTEIDHDLARDPADNDVPIAWAKRYGKGRVFYSTLGHSDQSWDNPLVQRMFCDAIRWSMGLVEGNAEPLGQ